MSYTSTQIEELFLDTESENYFNLIEYRMQVDAYTAPVSLIKKLRSNGQNTPSIGGGGVKSFKDKLLTTYGL